MRGRADACSGGTELLLAPPHAKQHTVALPERVDDGHGARRADMRHLIEHIRRDMIVEREELFVEGESVCVSRCRVC